MSTRNLLSLALLLSAGIGWTMRPQAQTPATVFVGVHVIPMDKEIVLRDQAVVIRDGTIASIGPAGKAQIPSGAVRIEAAGKYLIPALGELHAHIPGGQAPESVVERTLFLYAANGVGTIRGMLGDPRHVTNVGVYFKTEATTGTIAAGRRADLMLLDANPLEDIGNTTRIAGVMLNGKWLPKAEIDKRLASGT